MPRVFCNPPTSPLCSSGTADTVTLTAAFDLPLEASGNCVVVGGRRAGEERVAACVVPADSRADVNNLVKRRLDVRKATFLAMEDAVARTGMEYGGITPVGLPAQWRLFVDERLTAASVVLSPLVLVAAMRRYPRWWIEVMLRVRMTVLLGQTRQHRLERTPAGEVYVTTGFAALLRLEPGCGVTSEYVGHLTTAKNFETTPMYLLRREQPSAH